MNAFTDDSFMSKLERESSLFRSGTYHCTIHVGGGRLLMTPKTEGAELTIRVLSGDHAGRHFKVRLYLHHPFAGRAGRDTRVLLAWAKILDAKGDDLDSLLSDLTRRTAAAGGVLLDITSQRDPLEIEEIQITGVRAYIRPAEADAASDSRR